MDLADLDIHVWFSSPEETDHPEGPAPCDPVLDDEEKARMAKIHSPGNRRLFRESRVLLRRALSRYSDTPPEKWRFVKDAHGKPRIAPELQDSSLSFSLAHTQGLAIVAVTRGADIGADVERMDRSVDAAGLTRRFFSLEEIAFLQELSPERLRELFPFYWTLKESYVKARGLGLSLPLDSFSFRLAGKSPFRIDFSGDESERSEAWRFALFKPLPEYAAAVSIRAKRADPVRIRCFQRAACEARLHLEIETLGLSPGMEMNGDEKEIGFSE